MQFEGTGESGRSDLLRGIFPVVYTPFDTKGRIDDEDLAQLVAYLLEAGAHGLAAVGGASESHKMPVEERKWLAARTIDLVRGRVPVVVGTSGTNTAEAVDLSRHAAEVGATSVFLTPPLFGAVTPDALHHHYGAVANASEIPVMVQDALISVPPTQTVRLAEAFPTIRYCKEEAIGDTGHRISELKRLQPELGIFSGGKHLLDELARGAIGAIPGSIGVADLCRAYDSFVEGDEEGARAAFDHFTPLSFWSSQFPILSAKEVLRRLGIFKTAQMREPAGIFLDADDHKELSAIMEQMGASY